MLYDTLQCSLNLGVCVYPHVYTHVYAHAESQTHVHTHVCTQQVVGGAGWDWHRDLPAGRVYTHVCTHVNTHACARVRTHVHTHVCTQAYFAYIVYSFYVSLHLTDVGLPSCARLWINGTVVRPAVD